VQRERDDEEGKHVADEGADLVDEKEHSLHAKKATRR
jgi:hypothetical protein